MSHNITLKGVRFSDTQTLGNVVNDLSKGEATLDTNAKSFRTFPGQPTNCDACIKMPGAHDIGLKLNADGSYTPVFDPYAMDRVFATRESPIGELQREYGMRKAEYEAAQNGFTTQRVPGKNGVVTLELVASD